MNIEDLLTVAQASVYLGIGKKLVYQLSSSGPRNGRRITCYRWPGKILFKKEDLDAWMEAHRETPVQVKPETEVQEWTPRHEKPKKGVQPKKEVARKQV